MSFLSPVRICPGDEITADYTRVPDMKKAAANCGTRKKQSA
jgi:hypothetical protein